MHKLESKTAKNLKRLMGRMSQSELSREMEEAGFKVPQATISRILSGQKPDFDTAEKFAKFFHMSVPQFLGKEFWVPQQPEVYLSPKAIRLAKLYDRLPHDLQNSLLGIAQALLRTADAHPAGYIPPEGFTPGAENLEADRRKTSRRKA
jgi:transcriptional regulator with XRE-family HTH domain